MLFFEGRSNLWVTYDIALLNGLEEDPPTDDTFYLLNFSWDTPLRGVGEHAYIQT
jgi:hypothetical protein